MDIGPKPSTIIPPEILDRIFEHIPTNRAGLPTLIACASVATWWTGPSQRRLFSSVEIRDRNYERWMNNVVRSGSKAHLLGYVRSLQHNRMLKSRAEYPTRNLSRDSGEYLSALRNLRSFSVYYLKIEHISGEDFRTCFSAFRETLKFLSLENITTSFSAFVPLVDYFPNITTLEIRCPEIEPDEEPVPSLSRPLRGKVLVRIRLVPDNFPEFLDQFAKLDLEYEKLEISCAFAMETPCLESALRISPNTVKYLQLPEVQPGAAVAIPEFRQLRELELEVNWTIPHQVLPSITSTELRKVIFPVYYDQNRGIFAQRTGGWALIDKQLCELVDRLRAKGYRHNLEAELQVRRMGGDPGEYDFVKVLPEFREKGVVTIVDADRNDRVLRDFYFYE